VGADKAYDTEDFVATARELNVTVHVQKNEKGRRSRIDRRTTRHSGYTRSLSRRWLVEKTFGWLKGTGPLRQVKLRGLAKVDWIDVFSCAAHNLLRLHGCLQPKSSKTLSRSAPETRVCVAQPPQAPAQRLGSRPIQPDRRNTPATRELLQQAR